MARIPLTWMRSSWRDCRSCGGPCGTLPSGLHYVARRVGSTFTSCAHQCARSPSVNGFGAFEPAIRLASRSCGYEEFKDRSRPRDIACKLVAASPPRNRSLGYMCVQKGAPCGWHACTTRAFGAIRKVSASEHIPGISVFLAADPTRHQCWSVLEPKELIRHQADN